MGKPAQPDPWRHYHEAKQEGAMALQSFLSGLESRRQNIVDLSEFDSILDALRDVAQPINDSLQLRQTIIELPAFKSALDSQCTESQSLLEVENRRQAIIDSTMLVFMIDVLHAYGRSIRGWSGEEVDNARGSDIVTRMTQWLVSMDRLVGRSPRFEAAVKRVMLTELVTLTQNLSDIKSWVDRAWEVRRVALLIEQAEESRTGKKPRPVLSASPLPSSSVAPS